MIKVSRRQFLLGLGAAPLAAASVTAAYARLVEPYNYFIAETDILIRNLPPSFDGFRVTQLTDIHHSRILGIDQVQRTVVLANRTKPDLMVLTGDYTTSYRRYIEPCAEALGQLRAPEGVWAVLGNHDHYTDPELTRWSLERNRISVLNNRNTRLRRGSESIQLSGVDDWSWGGTEWTRAFYGLSLNSPTILLSHQPSVLDFPQTETMSLILSGHTHGGQINLPWIGPPARLLTKDLKYAHGLYRRGETQLYVSSGTGVIGLPVRFGVRPEIAVLRLRRATE
jgi:predicted MPP superfamily phosphohydrolase